MVMQACARSNTLYIRPHCATAQVCKLSKAADVCSTVGNAKESYNNLCQVKALVPVAQTCACSNTLQVWPNYSITRLCQVAKAAGMCCTVSNAKESHNEFHQVVPVAHVSNSAAHACGLHNLTETCNGIVWPYLWSIGACTSLCNWHQCLDLTEIVRDGHRTRTSRAGRFRTTVAIPVPLGACFNNLDGQ